MACLLYNAGGSSGAVLLLVFIDDANGWLMQLRVVTSDWSGTNWSVWAALATSIVTTEPPTCFARSVGIDCVSLVLVKPSSEAKC